MRRMIASAIALWFLGGAAGLADPAEGLWQTAPDDERHAFVQIEPCGDRVCGQVARAVDQRGEIPGWIARRTIFSMKPKSGGTYSGWVWRPSNDRIFSGRFTLAGNQITFNGCVIEGLICSGQVWTRID